MTTITPPSTDTATPTGMLSAEVVRLMRASHGIRAQIHASQSDGVEWAGSMLLFEGLPGMDAGFAVDVVAVKD